MQNVPMMMSFVLRIVMPISLRRTIVSRGARREIAVEEGHDLEAAQTALDARRVKLVPRALKNFEQNEIADKDRLGCHRGSEFRGRWR